MAAMGLCRRQGRWGRRGRAIGCDAGRGARRARPAWTRSASCRMMVSMTRATWVAASTSPPTPSPPPPSGTRLRTGAGGGRGCPTHRRRASGGRTGPAAPHPPPCGVVWRPVTAWDLEPSERLPTGWELGGGGGGGHWEVGASTIGHREDHVQDGHLGLNITSDPFGSAASPSLFARDSSLARACAPRRR